jgi:N-acetyl-gamma-glutamyl-phosphate reductase
MIADYEADKRPPELDSPRAYGLGMSHKHLPEMKAISGLSDYPTFSPVVGDFPRGMVVTIPLFARLLSSSVTVDTLRDAFANYYGGSKMVRVLHATEVNGLDGFIGANQLAGHDSAEIIVTGNDERIMLHARFDNLGKGASGAAIECMNVVLEQEKTLALDI